MNNYSRACRISFGDHRDNSKRSNEKFANINGFWFNTPDARYGEALLLPYEFQWVTELIRYMNL